VCDFNPYRIGSASYHSPRLTFNRARLFTVVKQFMTLDGTDDGVLSEIRRLYI
jgi:cellulose 1,4-beta-cellobiosidase